MIHYLPYLSLISKQTIPPREPFITGEGEEIDPEDYSNKFLHVMERKINNWLEGYPDYIIQHMSTDEVDYLLNHMQSTENDPNIPTTHLTRVEWGQHFFDANKKEGDYMDENMLLRSFSRTPDASEGVLSAKFTGHDVLIYRTVGDVPFFDPTKFSNPYPNQKEVFVPVDALKIDKVTTFVCDDVGDAEMEQFKEMTGFDESNWIFWEKNTVTVVDLVYDNNVDSVTVHMPKYTKGDYEKDGHKFSTKNLI